MRKKPLRHQKEHRRLIVADLRYIITAFNKSTVVSTQPLALAHDLITVLIPNIAQYDVLDLRIYAFVAKGISLLVLIGCSCFYLYKCYHEKRINVYLSLIAAFLLFGTALLPSIVFNMNDLIFILVSLAFSLCLLYSAIPNRIIKNSIVFVGGVVALITLLCNLPAGCMLIVLCGGYMGLYDFFEKQKNWNIILFWGVGGILVGVVLTHFFVISLSDCYDFLQKGISQTTNNGGAAHHSLMRVLLVILFGIRDLIITTLILCGITFACKIIFQNLHKEWLAILTVLVLFFIVYKWQVKPSIQIASVLCWLTICFLYYHNQFGSVKKKEILLIIFAFIMPIGLVFGTNTSIIGKAMVCSASWGFLLFYLHYLARKEVRKYATTGVLIVACCLFKSYDFSSILDNKSDLYFTESATIGRMKLTQEQKTFYTEVFDVLSQNGYHEGDTLLGFCFNEMTVVAMNAIPYTNDQQPEEFLLHDFKGVPIPKYMILTEWDSIVLHDRLSDLNWNFPEGYNYYKCTSNPDPNSGYSKVQSIIYTQK